MKFMLTITFCSILAISANPIVEAASKVSVDQNTSGVYKFMFETPTYSRTEERDANGKILGEYSFTDTDGIIHKYKYESGVDGFKIIEGDLPIAPLDFNLPVPEPFELVEQRRQHLELVNKLSSPTSTSSPISTTIATTTTTTSLPKIEVKPFMFKPEDLPMQVQDTPEVKAAREQHLKEHAAQVAFFKAKAM